MHAIGKYCLCLALTATVGFFPNKLFSQWYGAAEYRFGVNRSALSPLEIVQTNVAEAIAIPYTLGGYTISTGYTFRPDSLNVAFSAGMSNLKSRSGTILSTQYPNYPTFSAINHNTITADFGVSLEFRIKNVNSSTGFTLLLPVYMNGVELQQTITTSVLLEERREIAYRWGPGIRIHQNFSVWTNGRSTFFVGVSAGWISAQRKSRKLISKDPAILVSQREMMYLKNKQISEKGNINDPSLSGFNPDLPMETTTYNEPLSYVALKMGISFYLNKIR